VPDISSKLSIKIFAICTILFWFSYVFYLPPFIQRPDIKGLMNEGYGMYSLFNPNISKEQLEDRIIIEFYFTYAKLLFFIIAGITAGLFIYKLRRFGQIAAIVLCSMVLATRLFVLLREYPHVFQRIKTIYVFMLSQTPLQVIHKDIIGPIFFVFSIIFLSRLSVKRNFARTSS
jgi:hypothetical protein